MNEITTTKKDTLRIIQSLRVRLDNVGDRHHLEPVFIMALGLAANKIVDLESKNQPVDVINAILDEATEDEIIQRAHDIIIASSRSYPWWRNIIASSIGGLGTLVIAAFLFWLITYAHDVGLIRTVVEFPTGTSEL